MSVSHNSLAASAKTAPAMSTLLTGAVCQIPDRDCPTVSETGMKDSPKPRI